MYSAIALQMRKNMLQFVHGRRKGRARTGCDMECRLCPLGCGADREKETGACGAGSAAVVAKYGLHPYEEPCISGRRGSGTVFFSGCALRCAFCQNFDLSRAKQGKEITPAQLSAIFCELEERGAENINLVTASHFVPQLLRAFKVRRPRIPIVYNTHAYEKTEALRALDKYVDVWLPDLKFFSPKISARYTGKADYFEYASRAVAFMAKRTPDFADGMMVSGCIVRHLVLPLCTDDSVKIVQWFKELSSPAYLSLMGQYTPCGDIGNFPELKRRITPREYKKVLSAAADAGIERLFAQELGSADEAFIPDFSESTDTLF